MEAVLNRETNIVEFLIKKGANLDFHEKDNNNALIYAVRLNQMNIFKMLMDGGDNLLTINKNNDCNTILHSLIFWRDGV